MNVDAFFPLSMTSIVYVFHFNITTVILISSVAEWTGTEWCLLGLPPHIRRCMIICRIMIRLLRIICIQALLGPSELLIPWIILFKSPKATDFGFTYASPYSSVTYSVSLHQTIPPPPFLIPFPNYPLVYPSLPSHLLLWPFIFPFPYQHLL